MTIESNLPQGIRVFTFPIDTGNHSVEILNPNGEYKPLKEFEKSETILR